LFFISCLEQARLNMLRSSRAAANLSRSLASSRTDLLQRFENRIFMYDEKTAPVRCKNQVCKVVVLIWPDRHLFQWIRHCYGSGIFIPDPNISIPDPGSECVPHAKVWSSTSLKKKEILLHKKTENQTDYNHAKSQILFQITPACRPNAGVKASRQNGGKTSLQRRWRNSSASTTD
jgi:hypothetical protein